MVIAIFCLGTAYICICFFFRKFCKNVKFPIGNKQHFSILFWLIMTAFIAFIYAIFVLVFLLPIFSKIVVSARNWKECIVCLFLPFALSLFVAYFQSRKNIEYCLSDYRISENNKSILELYQSYISFLVLVIIAFCVFPKNSLYETVDLEKSDSLTFDLLLGWIVGVATSYKLAFDQVLKKWNDIYSTKIANRYNTCRKKETIAENVKKVCCLAIIRKNIEIIEIA